MTISPFRESAFNLFVKGYSVIPLEPKDKAPYREVIKDWSRLCEERLTQKEVKRYSQIDELNVGVALGPASGIIALDFDDNHQGLHEKIFKMLPETPVVKIGRKGFTAFYRYNGEVNRSWKVRLDSKKKLTIVELLSQGRQTVVPPSVHPSGDIYKYDTLFGLEDVDPDELPTLSNDIIEKIDILVYGEKREPAKVDIDVELSQVEEAIQYIDPDDYEDWVKVGMAIRSSFPDEGYDVWDSWSSKSPKYNPNEMPSKWESFNRGGISIGTLFYLAMQEGYEPKAISESLKNDVLNYFITLDQIEDTIDTWREKGRDMGCLAGVSGIDEKLHFRKGEVTVISGYGNCGKSEYLDSIAVGLMKNHNWRFSVCSFEKYTHKHFDDWIHKIVGRPRDSQSKVDYNMAKTFLRDHVVVIDHNKLKRSFDEILMQVARLKAVSKMDALIIDPFNYLWTPMKNKSPLEHVSHVIQGCCDFAKKHNIHVFIVAHPTKPNVTFGELPKPTKYSISGGADWVNIADNIILIHRDKEDKTILIVDKVRDQEVDSVGEVVLQYDKFSRCYGFSTKEKDYFDLEEY